MSTMFYSSIKARILEAQSEASMVINTLAERLRGFEKQLERKEDNRLTSANLGIALRLEEYQEEMGEKKITMDFMEIFSRLYIKEIVAGHGPRLDMSIAYHQRTMKTLEDMHSTCTIDFEENWDTHLPLVEFSYSNGYHQSVNCAPFESLYRRRCRLGKACSLESPTRTRTYLGTRRRDEEKVSATVHERYGLGRATDILGQNSL
ncbi:putative reverse transcriptase domain-containing protein [Tanacetum coccineum]